jgi:hypothetical protein
LAFEAYELYQLQLLSGRDLADPIEKIMSIYRASMLGHAAFPLAGWNYPDAYHSLQLLPAQFREIDLSRRMPTRACEPSQKFHDILRSDP